MTISERLAQYTVTTAMARRRKVMFSFIIRLEAEPIWDWADVELERTG